MVHVGKVIAELRLHTVLGATFPAHCNGEAGAKYATNEKAREGIITCDDRLRPTSLFRRLMPQMEFGVKWSKL